MSARSGAKAGWQPTEDTAADLGADARRYANRCLGVTARERGWYLQLGADPYTDNELLRRTVHHLAKVDAATRLGLKFAGVPGLPYAGERCRAMDAIDNADPAVRRARRRAVLAGYGLGGQEIHRFDDSLLLSPTRQQLLEDAAASLAEVDGRAELFGHAMTLSSEQAVQVFVHSLLLRARLHAQRPLARILAGPALPAAQLANGGVLVAAAFGAAYWIEPVAGLFATLRAPLPDGAQAPELWVSGEISPPAAAELTALVWSVDGGADSGPERQALPKAPPGALAPAVVAGERWQWCARRDSNPHALRRRILSPLRLPVPSRARPAQPSTAQARRRRGALTWRWTGTQRCWRSAARPGAAASCASAAVRRWP